MTMTHSRPRSWPIDGSELARRLLGDSRRVREYSRQDYVFVQDKVRATLTRLGCPRAGGERSRFIVDEKMAARVARELGREMRG
jgi:hypothetical protein